MEWEETYFASSLSGYCTEDCLPDSDPVESSVAQVLVRLL